MFSLVVVYVRGSLRCFYGGVGVSGVAYWHAYLHFLGWATPTFSDYQNKTKQLNVNYQYEYFIVVIFVYHVLPAKILILFLFVRSLAVFATFSPI